MKPLAWLLLAAAPVAADDWPQFRGPGGLGRSGEKDFPAEWSATKNLRWRLALPGPGNSSPIVSKGKVFVTASESGGRKRTLLCADRADGKLLWSRSVDCPAEPTHGDNPQCGSTPCADGERVIVWHSSGGLHAYGFDGAPLWSRDLGKFAHMWGYGASPVLHDGRVLLNAGPGARTFLTALDAKTGKTLWQQDEPGGDEKKWLGSWCTPRVAKIGGADQVIVAWPGRVKGYEPATGKLLWTVEGLGQLAYADVVIAGDLAVATGEDEAGDCLGLRLGAAPTRLWARPRALEVGTGAVVDGRLWTIDNGGIVRCTDMESGKEVHKERAPKGAAWSSLIQAAGRIYATSRSGETIVFSPDPAGIKVLAVNALGEPSNATPAFSDGEIFLRTSAALYAIGAGR